ncbi:hypothetical protein CVT26_013889 [Gymnopilus dilepis]|uniref:Uncharacterized protein n=1 Tax=Gymnopilus dilepis TaxID=231916 RepID=A0A409Y6C1_9AGAR|nr:hypothetical protein CVT26_013889 [Gymnopilus dilepis]
MPLSGSPNGEYIPQTILNDVEQILESLHRRLGLQGLFVEDLKSWTEKFKVGTVSKKKEGYRAAILGSLVAFSESGFAELQALSQARKALKKTKKGPET